MFVLFHSPGCLLLFFRYSSLYFFAVRPSSYFRLLLWCLVLASLLQCFFLLSLVASLTVALLPFPCLPGGCACCSTRLSLPSRCPVLSCLFLLPLSWFISLFCFPCLLPASLLSVVFTSALLGFVFLFFLCCLLRSVVSSLLSAAVSTLRWLFPAQVLGFRFPFLLVSCSVSSFTGYYFYCFLCFCPGVLFFLTC